MTLRCHIGWHTWWYPSDAPGLGARECSECGMEQILDETGWHTTTIMSIQVWVLLYAIFVWLPFSVAAWVAGKLRR